MPDLTLNQLMAVCDANFPVPPCTEMTVDMFTNVIDTRIRALLEYHIDKSAPNVASIRQLRDAWNAFVQDHADSTYSFETGAVYTLADASGLTAYFETLV